MLLKLMKKIIDTELQELTLQVEKISTDLSALSFAVASLAEIVREHQTSIVSNSYILNQISNKLKSAGSTVDLPDIKFSDDGEGSNEPN